MGSSEAGPVSFARTLWFGNGIFKNEWSRATVAMGIALTWSVPADAGFLAIGRHTPPPAHQAQGWDWTGVGDVVTLPPFDGLTSVESCRWVALDKPYAWRFTMVNKTGRTVSLDWGPFEFRKGENPFITGALIHHVTLKPYQSESRDLSLPLGCPNMRGGQSDRHYYYVISDHIKYAGDRTFTRDGFFNHWNAEAQKVEDDKRSSEAADGEEAQAQLNGIMDP